LERLRNLIVLQQVPDAVAKGLLDGADDELERMATQAEQFGAASLSRMADIVHTGLTDMRGTTAPRLVLELIAARMLLPGADESSSALLARMERMERRLTFTGSGSGSGEAEAVPPSGVSYAPPPIRDVAPATPGGTADPSPRSGRAAGAPAAGGATGVSGQRPGEPSQGAAASGTGADGPPVTTASGHAGAPGQNAARGDAARGDASGGDATVGDAPGARGAGGQDGRAAAAAVPAGSGAVAVAAPAASPPAPTQAAPHPVAAGAPDAAEIRRHWNDALAYIGRQSKKGAAMLRDAMVRDVVGDTLVLLCTSPFHADWIGSATGTQLVQDALYEIFNVRWKIRCEVAGQNSAPARVPSGRSAPAAPRPEPSRPEPPTSATSAPVSADGAGDDDWPTPAKLGGSGADGGASAAGPATGSGNGSTSTSGLGAGPASGGPTDPSVAAVGVPAVHGPTRGLNGSGDARVAAAGSSGGHPTDATPGAPAGLATPGAGLATPGAGLATPGAPAGLAAARAAASRSAGAARGRPAKTGSDSDAWSGTESEEPPFDPEFDGPNAAPRTSPSPAPSDHVGFDPGDEPADDDGDPATAASSTEQQALQLLREALGAEKI